MKAVRCILKILGGLFILPLVLVSLLMFYWDLRTPPSFETDPVLKLSHWTAVSSDNMNTRHNSNTDLTFFRGNYYLIHAQTKWHLEDRNGRLLVHRSRDAKKWTKVAEITVPDIDVRDPKFAVIKNRLFVYFLPNLHFDPFPETTYWTVSEDGEIWKVPSELKTVTVLGKGRTGRQVKVTGGGWKLWRPKTPDRKTWYVAATGKKSQYPHWITVLLKSTDGLQWEEVSELYTTFRTDEPAIEFMRDKGIIATLRCGGMGTKGYEFGNPTANTVIASSAPPYKDWSYSHSFITRLDGETLFRVGNRIFAAGRSHLGPRFDMGNHLARKRTSLYEVKRDRLIHLFDLPSNGDTGYTGVVQKRGSVYVSYYTCPVKKDYPWIIGICFYSKTDVRMARFNTRGLIKYANSVPEAQFGAGRNVKKLKE